MVSQWQWESRTRHSTKSQMDRCRLCMSGARGLAWRGSVGLAPVFWQMANIFLVFHLPKHDNGNKLNSLHSNFPNTAYGRLILGRAQLFGKLHFCLPLHLEQHGKKMCGKKSDMKERKIVRKITITRSLFKSIINNTVLFLLGKYLQMHSLVSSDALTSPIFPTICSKSWSKRTRLKPCWHPDLLNLAHFPSCLAQASLILPKCS